MIFETERLAVRSFRESDKDLFFKMMSNPNVMNPIPQKVMTKSESDLKFEELRSAKNSSLQNIWVLTEKERNEFIGLCGFLKNDEEEDEIAYRLMERYWGNGYGTEIAKGLVEFGFTEMRSNKITADVNIANLKSVKILERFLNPAREFYNERDKCVDRRYAIYKNEYPKN